MDCQYQQKYTFSCTTGILTLIRINTINIIPCVPQNLIKNNV